MGCTIIKRRSLDNSRITRIFFDFIDTTLHYTAISSYVERFGFF